MTSNPLQTYAGYKEADLGIISRFKRSALPEPGFIVDFLGVKTRVSSLWPSAGELSGRVIDLPIPADYHAEAIEYIGTLKSVEEADGSYVMAELGAGWGPWSVGAAIAARNYGIKDVRVYAVEADPNRFPLLQQHFRDNDLDVEHHKLTNGIIGSAPGVAEWPVLAMDDFGGRPISGGADYRGNQVSSIPIQVISFSAMLSLHETWDLLHIDVQGHEVDICKAALSALTDRVKRMVIGTHSRRIEADLIDLLGPAGWFLEHEKPCKFDFHYPHPSLEAMTTLDGTQVWTNRTLKARSALDQNSAPN